MQNVDTRITPSLHPENVTAIEGYGDDTASELAPTLTAFNVAYSNLIAIHDARTSAKTNPTWNVAQQILATDDYASKRLTQITQAFDAARHGLAAGIDNLEKELSEPVSSNAANPISAEIRAHVKAMKSTERLDFITHAIEAGDEVTAMAVLGTVPFLSGINGEMQDVLTRLYRRQSSPDKAKRLAVLTAAKDLIEDRGRLLFKEVERAVGASPSKVKALRDAKTAAERAFIIRDAA
ncbi:MAG: hypothetical protein IT550_15395 [Novosphingobium sp.]|jgi:hypothetical protein|nr:hypothetical protein [Novosphingobium sp.]